MRRFIALVILGCACSVLALGQSSEDIKFCDDLTDLDQTVIHCTAEIESGQVSAENLPLVYYNRGLAHLRKNEYDLAIHDFDDAIRLRPSDYKAFQLRGSAYIGKHDYDRALQNYDESIRLHLNNSEAFASAGYILDAKGSYSEAVQNYDQAIRLDPKNSDAFYRRGRTYFKESEYARAIENYNKALELDPTQPDALYHRGMAYFSTGEVERAIQDYSEAIHLRPGDPTILVHRCQAYEFKREYERAIQDCDETLRLDPKSYYAFSSRGINYFRMGRYDEAIADLDKAIELAPRWAYPLVYRATAYNQKGDFTHALRDLDQADALGADNSSETRGEAHFYLGAFTAAQSDFSISMAQAPSIYTALWLYLTQARTGQDGRAALEKNISQLDRKAWPAPIAELFLGSLTPEQILSSANDPNEKKNREQHCEAYFYLGEYALLGGHRRQAKEYFDKSISAGAVTFIEYTGARAELVRLKQHRDRLH